MWSIGFSDSVQSLVMVPIVLYQAEQILCGQIAVQLFRRWARDEWNPKEDISTEGTTMEMASVTTISDQVEEQTNSRETVVP
jgi:hypothetical protein